MKKNLYLFFLLLSFFALSIKTNAMVPLCIYKSIPAISDEGKGAYITLENNSLVVTMESRLGMLEEFSESINIYANTFATRDPRNLIPVYSFFNSDFMNNRANYLAGTKSYTITNNGDSAVENFQADNASSDTISVYWDSQTLKSNFFNYGYCPGTLIEDASGSLLDSDSIGFGPEIETNDDADEIISSLSNTWNKFNTVIDAAVFQNRTYYLERSMFRPDSPFSVSDVSTCMTSNDMINNYTMLFMFNDSYSNTEKAYLRNLGQKNGYDAIADKIIELYGENSSCRSSHPNLSDKYTSLYNAALNYRNFTTGEMATGDIDCDGIIGDPSIPGHFAYYLNKTIKFIQYLGPVLVIVFTTIEYIKALIAGDADALKKANKRTVTRLVFAVLLFLIPAIINAALSIFKIYSDCSIITNI